MVIVGCAGEIAVSTRSVYVKLTAYTVIRRIYRTTNVGVLHLLQRLCIWYGRGLLDRPVMLLLWDANPDISFMGSSGTSLARSAVAHGECRSGLLEKIASGGRSQKDWSAVGVGKGRESTSPVGFG